MAAATRVAGPVPVTFVISHALSGGSERYLELLLERLERGWVHGVLSLQDGPFVERLRERGFEVDVVETGARLSMLASAVRVRRLLRADAPAVVHANGVKAALVAALATPATGIPVIWVGLPSQRGTKSSQDSSYLNELYRSRAEKAGIIYADIWDGFVDESGGYSPQGPDYEGQIRRLRSGDGVYFTKYGARKLAHYVEREIQRIIGNKSVPVALPMPAKQPPQAGKPGGPAERPIAGPVVPLTAAPVERDELLGGGHGTPSAVGDETANRVLTNGASLVTPSGRADDFSWPRADVAEPVVAEPASAPSVTPEITGARAEQKPRAQRRMRTSHSPR